MSFFSHAVNAWQFVILYYGNCKSFLESFLWSFRLQKASVMFYLKFCLFTSVQPSSTQQNLANVMIQKPSNTRLLVGFIITKFHLHIFRYLLLLTSLQYYTFFTVSNNYFQRSVKFLVPQFSYCYVPDS